MSEAAHALVADGADWRAQGPITMDTAAGLLEASSALPLPASGIVDLAQVHPLDSAAVAILLAWRRRAAAEGRALRFAHMPPALVSLAGLYGVEALIAG